MLKKNKKLLMCSVILFLALIIELNLTKNLSNIDFPPMIKDFVSQFHI